MITTNNISDWNTLLLSLHVDPAHIKEDDVPKIKKWCQLNIKSNCSDNSLKTLFGIVSAYCDLNKQISLGVIIDDKLGYTVLHKAAKLGFDRFLEDSLSQCTPESQKLYLNAQSSAKNTPLHLAAMSGETAAVEVLLEHGADANKFNNAGKLPIQMVTSGNAIMETKKMCIKVLLIATKGELLTSTDQQGMSLLLSSIPLDDLELIEHIIAKNKEVLYLTNPQGENALHLAIIHQCTHLIDYFANLEKLLLQRTGNHSNAAHLACRYGNEDIVKNILNRDLPPDYLATKDEHGTPALDYLILRPELKTLFESLNGNQTNNTLG